VNPGPDDMPGRDFSCGQKAPITRMRSEQESTSCSHFRCGDRALLQQASPAKQARFIGSWRNTDGRTCFSDREFVVVRHYDCFPKHWIKFPQVSFENFIRFRSRVGHFGIWLGIRNCFSEREHRRVHFVERTARCAEPSRRRS
jgi:hypothetical protein